MQISAVAIVVTAVCAMFLFYNILKDQIFDDLKSNACNFDDGHFGFAGTDQPEAG